MSKAELLKKYGAFYKENYGKDEYSFLRNQDTRGVRDIISHIDPEPVKKFKGGVTTKKKPTSPIKKIGLKKGGSKVKKSGSKPSNPKLYASVKAEAKRKFKVYPSAYANAWLVRTYKKRGGGYA